MGRSFWIRIFVLLSLVAVSAPAVAGPSPLAAANLAPQHLFLLEPAPEDPAIVEHRAFGLRFDYATIYFHVRTEERTRADLDLEVARVLLSYAQTLPGKIEARLEVPVLWMGAGTFDGLVNEFHDTLSLPTGTRKRAPMNEYHYAIMSDRHSYTPDPGVGLGDAVLRFKREIQGELPLGARLAGRFLVKLPTGSPRQGFGSGSADAALGVVATVDPGPWTLFGALDGVYLGGSPDPVLSMDTHFAMKASGGLGLKVWNLGELTTQVEYFTTPYNTGSKNLDRNVTMFSLGFQRVSSYGVLWSAGATEDLASRASPDFSIFIHAELRR